MNNNESSNSGMMIGILVVVIIAVVAWIAYTQGLFTAGEKAAETKTVDININDNPATPPGVSY